MTDTVFLGRHAAQKQFDEYLRKLRDGYLPVQYAAVDLADAYGFAKGPLNEALDIAYRRVFEIYVSWVRAGRLSFEENARDLAQERGYSMAIVDEAVARGKPRALSLEAKIAKMTSSYPAY
ncbi:MAG: hypothetical protein AB7E79_13050 [Rhodospirillaceae bacterium]